MRSIYLDAVDQVYSHLGFMVFSRDGNPAHRWAAVFFEGGQHDGVVVQAATGPAAFRTLVRCPRCPSFGTTRFPVAVYDLAQVAAWPLRGLAYLNPNACIAEAGFLGQLRWHAIEDVRRGRRWEEQFGVPPGASPVRELAEAPGGLLV